MDLQVRLQASTDGESSAVDSSDDHLSRHEGRGSEI